MIEYIFFGLTIALFAALGYAIKILVDAYLVKWARRTKTKVDDIIIRRIRAPIILIFTVAGISMALPWVRLPPSIKHWVDITIFILIVFAITFAIARVLAGLINYYGALHTGIKPIKGIIEKAVNVVVFLLGFMVILDALKVSFAPLIATVGIGGIALAFALQETLSNFFAGFYLMADRPIREGDYVKLESGEKGYVLSVGWRSTKIKMISENVIVVPNSKLANTILTNYYMPKKELRCAVNVGVSYESDLEKVERVTVDVAKKVLRKLKGGVTKFEPIIRYTEFDDFSINFKVILRVKEYIDRRMITHEFIKALHKRYKKEGIEIPYPIRTIYQK